MSENTQTPQPQQQQNINEDEFYEQLLFAIDQAKPPSIWRERAFFMVVGLLGGMGIGVVLIIFAIK